jgi:hypothetical protein
MFHVTSNGIQQGPINEAEVRARIARGELRASDLCWQVGWPAWRPLGEVLPEAFAGAANAGAPPPPPPPPATTPAPAGKPKTSGLAVASLVCGICTIVLFPLFLLFMLPAIICGHVAYSKIKQSQGALGGSGIALAGLIMGYFGVVMFPIVGLMAAMAIPAFQKVRQTSLEKMMQNDARQIAAATQQYLMETNEKSVTFSYDAKTGKVSGPLATYVKQIGKGYTVTPTRLTADEDFELGHPILGPPRTFSPEGQPR